MKSLYLRIVAASLVLAPIFCVAGLTVRSNQLSAGDFPLSKGSYWLYRGIVRYFDAHSVAVVETHVKWEMRITERIQRGNSRAAIVNGFPADLDWSDGNPKRCDSLLVELEGKGLYWIGTDETPDALEKIRNSNASMSDIVTVDDQLLDLPLANRKKYGCDSEAMKRSDSEYCWTVDSSYETSLSDVTGVSHEPRKAYTIRYVTNPDDTTLDFVPGVGFTSYAYHHHGTEADTEIKLVEFHPGPHE